MIIYSATFVSSLVFMRVSQAFKKNREVSAFFLVIAIAIPCYLASQRDISIGADTQGYISGMYNLAVKTKSSLFHYLAIAPPWYAVPRTIVGYMSLTWVCAQFSNGFQILLFLITLLSILPVYFAIKKVSNNTNEVMLSYTLYFLFIYNITFNAARQTIALGFYLLAFVCMMKKQYKRTVIYSIISFSFHDTALLIVAIAIIKYLIVDKTKSSNAQKKYECIMIVMSALAVIGFYPLLSLLIHSGIYSHGSVYLAQRRFDFSFIKTGLYLLVYIVISLNKKNMVLTKEDEFYRFISLLSVIWLQIGVFITYADRLSWYFFFPVIHVYLPQIAYGKAGKIKKKRGVYTAIIIMAFIVYWIVLYGVINEHNTVPYVFRRG